MFNSLPPGRYEVAVPTGGEGWSSQAAMLQPGSIPVLVFPGAPVGGEPDAP